ncbi:MAG: MFS transporter [Myxococcota bacterium]
MLERLALHRPELRAWALYDWANSAFFTTVVTAIFPVYFATVAAKGLPSDVATSRYAFATTVALSIAAVLGPVLGSFADRAPLKKRFLAFFVGLGALSTALLWFVGEGDWVLGAILFGIGNLAASSGFVFYDALLPHIASADEMDRVSVAGYAIGYLGGGLLLAINVAWVLSPETFGLPDAGVATRLSFVSVAVWWAAFSIPLFRRVPEPAVAHVRDPNRSLVGDSFRGLARTLKELRSYREAALFMLAFLLYNDGIQTIIRMAAVYSTEIGMETSALIQAVLLVQVIGIPFAFLFGQLADKLGSRRAIGLGIVAYAGVSILAWQMDSSSEFFALAIIVGMVQGGTQALSRSLFASLIPAHRSAEFFGLFAVMEKFAGIFGPALFGIVVAVTGSSRHAILSVIVFFIVGGLLLSHVDIEAGQRQARAASA